MTISSPPVCSRNFTPPTVKILQSSCDDDGHFPPTIQLLCLISGYTPGAINVTWLENGQVMKVNSPTPPATQEGELASTQSEFTLAQKHWLSDRTYTCQVTYQGTTYNDSTKKCAGTFPPALVANTEAREGGGRASHSPPVYHRFQPERGECLPKPAQPV